MPGFLHNPDAGKDSAVLTFAAGVWGAGTKNEIDVVPSGAAAAGQIGPHGLITGTIYDIQVYRDLGGGVFDHVDVEMKITVATGLITLKKAPGAPAFGGQVIVEE